MDASIILQGRGVDALGSFSRGNALAQQVNQTRDQNALRMLNQTQGPQIMAGDPNALNALARLDPNAAMAAQQNAFAMEQQRAAVKQKAAEWAQSQRAEVVQAEAAKTEQLLKGAAYFHAQGDRAGYDAYVRQQGGDPAQYPFEMFPAIAAQAGDVLEVWKTFQPEKVEAVKPMTTQGKLKADLDAGLITQDQFNMGMAALAPKGETMVIDPATGTMTVTRGAPVGGAEPTIGQVYNPNEINSVLGMIRDIRENPALPGVLGTIEGGGGNNIDDMSALRRAYYGGEGTALIERIGQLQSNAWLSARQMLKGGGAITDYESRKAEGAVARLSRAKSEAEFIQALNDLEAAIIEGARKLNVPIDGLGPQTPPRAEDASLPPSAAPAAPSGPARLRFNPETGDFE